MDASTAASSRLRITHERGATSPTAPQGVRDLVAESWHRCAASGVPLDGGRLPLLRTTREELTACRLTHPLAPVLPLFRELLGAGAADDGHIFAVGDADGTLLWVEGDSATRRRAEAMHFTEGALWTEAQIGTNAPGTALELARPVQIVTGEHYNCAVQDWSCAAAPVRDPGTGRVLGVVDLTGGVSVATPPAFAAVRAAALAAEAELAHRPAARLGEDAGVPWARLTALGRDSAVLETDGRVLQLSRRHSEIVVALALAGHGVSGERLCVDLSEREVPASTLRAEMTRLRAVLGPALLGSRPYAVRCAVHTDFGDVADLLAAGRVAEALARYPGPLLPRSEAPVVVEQRRSLEQQLRGAVLATDDTALLRRWVSAEWGAADASAWLTLAHRLPGGSAQRAAAAARARALNAPLAVPPQLTPRAAWLQRSHA